MKSGSNSSDNGSEKLNKIARNRGKSKQELITKKT
jgi:hypothetical protein